MDKPVEVDPDLYPVVEPYHVDDWQSETTSIASSLYRGLEENGRRYQTLKAADSYVPSDDQQFAAYEAGHIAALVMDSDRENPLFRAPIADEPGVHILDIGTGQGTWAVDVADMLPEATVRGVDLFPPPVKWMPPNCVLEVDDVLQDWTWKNKFDLIHMRIMDAAFNDDEREKLYSECYKNLRPGGWIEQLELSPVFESDDGSLPEDALLRGWAPITIAAAAKSGRPLDMYHKFEDYIRDAGFVDIQTHKAKWPVGPWARDKRLKEAGVVNLSHWSSGMDGYGMFLLTKYGSPVPWSKEEVLVYVAKLRKELINPKYHIYHRAKRVWARKPFAHEIAAAQEQTGTGNAVEPQIKREPTL